VLKTASTSKKKCVYGAQTVSLKSCVDGDTVKFSNIGKTRLLAVDTPELTGGIKASRKKAK